MAVTDSGFKAPTPIQQKTIPALIAGENDLVGLAPTGSGKTGARLDGSPVQVRADFKDKRPRKATRV